MLAVVNVIGKGDRGGKKLKKVERLLAAFKLASRKNSSIVKHAMIARKLPAKGFDALREGRVEDVIMTEHWRQEVSKFVPRVGP